MYRYKKISCIMAILAILVNIFSGISLNSEVIVKAATENVNESVDKDAPLEISATYKVLNRKATVTVDAFSGSGIASIKYLKGDYKKVNHKNWDKKGKDITKKKTFKVTKDGIYSILAVDKAGNKKIYRLKVTLEFRAVWIAYYDFGDSKGSSEEDFTAYVDKMFDNAVEQGMNAVVVHVRPFSDAMYKSKYYPWSVYASGKQGEDPGYDPLKIMVKEAHDRGLELHAWLNPYRITSSGTDVSVLAENNPARVWLTDDDPTNDRNVLSLSGKLYYNPSKKAVQKLIVNGIKEIVKNYGVDGIHFDDYFYPEYLGPDYQTIFDGEEYQEYKAERTAAGKKVLSIDDWRRNNVNTLVKSIYSAVKSIDETVEFGISPGGYIDHLLKIDRNYVDFPTWLSNPGYVDYICPQLYWSFDKKWNTFPYDTTLLRWIDYRTDPSVKVYVGVGTYKCTAANTGSTSVDAAWKERYILADMVDFARETGCVDGFIFFDYADMIRGVNKSQVKALTEALAGTLVRTEEEDTEEPEVIITEGDELIIEIVGDKDDNTGDGTGTNTEDNGSNDTAGDNTGDNGGNDVIGDNDGTSDDNQNDSSDTSDNGDGSDSATDDTSEWNPDGLTPDDVAGDVDFDPTEHVVG